MASSHQPNSNLKSNVSAAANALVVVLAFFFVLSVTPLLSRRHTLLWRLAMQATILAHAARLYKAVGIPYLWPLSFAEFKVWFKNVSQYSDLHYLLTGFMFLPQRPFMPALVSPVVLAVMREAAFCKEKLGGDSRVGKLCDRVLSSNARAALFELMALMDISMLPMIIVLAMLRRMSIVLPFVYLNLLYQRYHHPAGSKYHQPVWSQFGNRVQPYKEKLPPALQRGIDWCVARFQTSPAHLKSPAQQQ